MAWLSGWSKRVKLTTNAGDVDAALSDFPVLLYISTSSGYNTDDISFVFDELTSDANRKKIAVTTSDGTTQCYVEIEKWDDAAEKAWLWVKAPSISAADGTVFYLYYDADHADNTDYVGDPGSTPAQNVWDDNFTAVYHMTQPNLNNYKLADGVYTGVADELYVVAEGAQYYHEGKWKSWKRIGFGADCHLNYYESTNGINWTRIATGMVADHQQHHVMLNDEFKGKSAMDSTRLYDAGTTAYTDYTAASNSDTANDVKLLPDTRAEENDAIYFGSKSKFNELIVQIGTPGVKGDNAWVITWEYSKGSGNWGALQDVVDGTQEFTAASGERTVTFTVPSDWAKDTINTSEQFYLRARVSSAAAHNYTTQPLGTQCWIIHHYWCFASDMVPTGRWRINLWLGATGQDFVLDKEGAIPLGGSGTWDEVQVANSFVWKEGTNSWKMMYEGYATIGGKGGYRAGLATSTDGKTWTKDAGNPVTCAAFDSNRMSAPSRLAKIGDTYYHFTHGNYEGTDVPSRIHIIKSTDLKAWTLVGRILDRTLAWEGIDGASSQVADPHVVEHEGQTYIYYFGQATQSDYDEDPIRMGLVLYPTTIEALIHIIEHGDSTNSVAATKKSYLEPQEADGKIGKAQQFDGSDDYINLGNNFNPGTGSWTGEAWFTAAASKATQTLIDKRHDVAPDYVWPFHILVMPHDDATNPGKIRYGLRYGATIDLIYSASAVNDGNWHYLSAVRTAGTNAALYHNAAAAVTATGTKDSNLTNVVEVFLGRATPAGTSYLTGKMDEVRFSNVARSAAWVKASYESGRDHLLDWGSEQEAHEASAFFMVM